MGYEYFAFSVKRSSAEWEDGASARPNPFGAYVATYASNFTKLPPEPTQKWYSRGHAQQIRSIPTDGPKAPDTNSSYEYKDVSKSHGKKWKERNKNGLILVTPWKGYRLDISRNVQPELAESPNAGLTLFWKQRFNAQNVWYDESATRPYYWVNGYYTWQRVVGYKYIMETRISDEEILGSFQLAPEYSEASVTAALAEANQGYYDLLTELAELPETLSYIYGLLAQAKEASVASAKREVYFKHMFKRKLLTAAQLATALADVWLQYRYAISPIVYSLQDIEKTLGVYSRLFKTARQRDDMADVAIPKTIGGLTLQGYSGSTVDRVFIKRAYSAEGLVDGILRNISLNPFATAWELVPLSFVVDWFVNIGDVISAYTGPQVHVQQVATISRKHEFIATYVDENELTIDIKLNSYQRDTFNPLDHVGLSFDPFINWKRTLDALALSWAFTKDDWMKSIKRLR